MAMKKVLLPKVSPWTQKAVDELLKFPNTRHDDFVDTLAWVGMGLSRLAVPGGVVSKDDLIPEVGTMGWVKYASRQEQKEIKHNKATGGW
jgi:hypothetical protein